MRRICLIALLFLPAGCGLLDDAPPPAGSAPAASVAVPPVAAPSVPSGVIKAGDTLRITVAGEDELSGAFTVGADGTLHLELLGSVTAGGLTPAALAENLRQRLLGGYLKNPQVAVIEAPSAAPRMAGALPPPALRKSETDQ